MNSVAQNHSDHAPSPEKQNEHSELIASGSASNPESNTAFFASNTEFRGSRPGTSDPKLKALLAVRRILLIDDNQAIHQDFQKIFDSYAVDRSVLSETEEALFGKSAGVARVTTTPSEFALDSAFQGKEGLELVKRSCRENRPYNMAFVDVRMPPGWDGVETVAQIWKHDPDIQVVICTAYSDYSWGEMIEKLGHSDRLVILKKPFDNIEVLQLASALTEKWRLLQQNRAKLKELEMQYRHAQKMEALGQLTGGLAHDFNNVLSIINGYSELLLDTADPTSGDMEMLREIYAASERAAKLIRQLMTFSRTRSIHLESLDLDAVVADVVKMLRRLIGGDIKLLVKSSDEAPLVVADKGMLEQVLVNLAVNARDAMPKGGDLIISTETVVIEKEHVKLHPDARPGQCICLSVKDTGSGMTSEVLSRIFEPFFTTKEANKGTGLGLAMVSGIVKQHEGWIEAESEPGIGTTFNVFLPAASQPINSKEASAQIAVAKGKETILLVEDEPNVRSMAMLVLEKYGYRVLEAESGEEALQVWKRHSCNIDLLLTDMVMPGDLTGHDLANQLRIENPDLKVIYTSGYRADMAGKIFESTYKDSFIQKPCHPRKLAAAVRATLDGIVIRKNHNHSP